jgi:hypothetical protein
VPRVGITDPELEWCKANAEVPEAAEVLRLYGEKYASIIVPFTRHQELADAVDALRKIRPRSPVAIDQIYAWVNPSSKHGGEDIPAIVDNGKLILMLGTDAAHIQGIDCYRPILEKGLSMPMVLYRYERGPEIPRSEIHRVYQPESGTLPPHGEIDTIFALVTRFDSGDEGVAAYTDKQYGHVAMLFTRREHVGIRHPDIDYFYHMKKDVTFRTFIKRRRLGR